MSMKPIKIPTELIPEGFRKVFVGPPDNLDQEVKGVEAVFRDAPGEPPMYLTLIHFDDDAIRDIVTHDGNVWLAQITDSMVPFTFTLINELRYD